MEICEVPQVSLVSALFNPFQLMADLGKRIFRGSGKNGNR